MTSPVNQTSMHVSSVDVPSERLGDAQSILTSTAVAEFISGQLSRYDFAGKSVCVIVPDATRSCPLPQIFAAAHEHLHGLASRITVVVALGTHAYMSEPQLAKLLGYEPGQLGATYPGVEVVNHEWQDPVQLVTLGEITAAEISELSQGRLQESVAVTINRHVVEHDVALVIGPVFPHEVVGFSGGNKYFFPGVAGPEVIDMSHWLGALITSYDIIGTTGITPVRALINAATALLPCDKLALTLVVESGTPNLHAVSFGDTESAWASAAEVSRHTHIKYVAEPYQRIVSVMPTKYDDFWTGAKGFYKTEPICADGGEVIIYAPHIRSIAEMHPEIELVGYHCRDYFVKQWAKFRHIHWGVLAHSTHGRGQGTYDAQTGIESCRVRVTLATGISPELCAQVNMGYLDPASVDLATFRSDPNTLVLDPAGEVLYRVAD